MRVERNGNDLIPVIQVMGPKNSGKTHLANFLISGFTGRGYRVGSLKHTSHEHPLDKPGADSDQHRQAGALPAVFQTPEGVAVFETGSEISFALLKNTVYAGCQLIVVESFEGRYGPVVLTDPGMYEQLKDEREILAVTGLNSGHSLTDRKKTRPNDPASSGGRAGFFSEPGDDLLDWLEDILMSAQNV